MFICCFLCSGSVQECHTATWATWKFCSTDSSASYKASGIYHLLHWWRTHFLDKLALCWFSMMTCETKVTMWCVRVHEFVHFGFSWILVCLYIYIYLCVHVCALLSVWFECLWFEFFHMVYLVQSIGCVMTETNKASSRWKSVTRKHSPDIASRTGGMVLSLVQII